MTEQQGASSRLFVAIELPKPIKDILSDAQRHIRKLNCLDGKYTKPENIHLTLKFLGETEDTKIDGIIAALQKVRFDEFKLNLGAVGKFPEYGEAAHVIWVDVQGDGLMELAVQVESALAELCGPADKSFKPHLTLLRVKTCKDPKKLLLALPKISIECVDFSANQFALIKSELSTHGPKYTVLKAFSPTRPVAKSRQL